MTQIEVTMFFISMTIVSLVPAMFFIAGIQQYFKERDIKRGQK